jgi:succinate dehydrogenase / fumarate reductase membrane anchor subunit
MQTDLGKVRGLGTAKSGTHHWWMQRVTAVALIPLFIWFISSFVALIGADHATVVEWIKNPFTTTFLIALVVALFYHLNLGVQVIIEDYIHTTAMKIFMLYGVKFGTIVLGLISITSILKISFGS